MPKMVTITRKEKKRKICKILTA